MHITWSRAFRRRTLSLAVLSTFAGGVGAADGITDLGKMEGGGYSAAFGVSANGNVVVGYGDQCAGAECIWGDRAFMWTQAGGMVSLGILPGGSYSTATGVSADGQVIVGMANDSGGNDNAFRWTQTGGMVSLGTLNGGSYSRAYAVSGDGNVVVGDAQDGAAGFLPRAFRWTLASGMVSLGNLNGGQRSSALGVNSDGSVIVGVADDGAVAGSSRAFRWTQAGGMVSLGTLTGYPYSQAYGVSGDGSVVVGWVDGSESLPTLAFRWTQAGGMVSLGTLNGGTRSEAHGISTDGRVIVGQAADGSDGNTLRAFRWTQAGGMTTVEQWLRNAGVTVASNLTRVANATNADGSVVVGQLANNDAFIARVSPIGSGLIDVPQYVTSLDVAARPTMAVLAPSDLVLNGAHGNPMRDLLGEGKSSVWVTGDWGRTERRTSDGMAAAGEVGWSRGLGALQVKLAVGKTYDEQDFDTGGGSRLYGIYVVPEAIWHAGGGLHATVSGYYNRGDVDVRRGYLNAGAQDYSRGTAGVATVGGRLRLDWLNAFGIAGAGLTPYGSITSLHTRIDGYTETGGGFPARWDKRTEKSNILRVGIDAARPVASGSLTLLGRLEGAWRAERESTHSTGQVLGFDNFDLAGTGYRRSWLRAGVGAEGGIAGGTASLMLNGTTQGGRPDYWLAASYRINF